MQQAKLGSSRPDAKFLETRFQPRSLLLLLLLHGE
jgi:hypothetical protein